MLHVSSCHSKWVMSRIDFAHLAGTGLGGYSCASKCQIVVVHGSSRSSPLIPMGNVYRWSVRVLLNSNVCFWTRIRKWRRSQSHCDSFCAPWVSKWEPIQLEIFGFLSGLGVLATSRPLTGRAMRSPYPSVMRVLEWDPLQCPGVVSKALH